MEPSQPDVQFTTSPDGLGIAFWEIGSGPALVMVHPMSVNHAELEWSVPSMKSLYLDLARYFRVIRLDVRGTGMSDDPPSKDQFTLAGFGRDIDAVATALGLAEFNLMGITSMGPTVVRYAVDHPERVAGLVLCESGPAIGDLPVERYGRAVAATAEFDVIPSFGPIDEVSTSEELAATHALIRASLFNRPFSGVSLDSGEFDVDAILGEVSAPTLVLRATESLFSDTEQSRRLVAGISGAKMRVVPGVLAPWHADTVAVIESLVSFLTSDHYEPAAGVGDEMRTIVFTDLVSSTALLNQLGDERGRAEVRNVEAAVDELCAEHRGRLVKNLGDGSLLSFKSTASALSFSVALQDRMALSPFGMRIGMAAGEPIQERGDIHGAVVVQASRIGDLGDGGEVIVSDAVRQLAVGKDFLFEPWGDIQLKGFDELSTLWRVSAPTHG